MSCGKGVPFRFHCLSRACASRVKRRGAATIRFPTQHSLERSVVLHLRLLVHAYILIVESADFILRMHPLFNVASAIHIDMRDARAFFRIPKETMWPPDASVNRCCTNWLFCTDQKTQTRQPELILSTHPKRLIVVEKSTRPALLPTFIMYDYKGMVPCCRLDIFMFLESISTMVAPHFLLVRNPFSDPFNESLSYSLLSNGLFLCSIMWNDCKICQAVLQLSK